MTVVVHVCFRYAGDNTEWIERGERRSEYFWTRLAGRWSYKLLELVRSVRRCRQLGSRLAQLRVKHGGFHKPSRHADFDLRAFGKMLARCSRNVGLVRTYAAIARQAGAQKGHNAAIIERLHHRD